MPHDLRSAASEKRRAADLAIAEIEATYGSPSIAEQDKRRALAGDYGALISDERRLLALVTEVEQLAGLSP